MKNKKKLFYYIMYILYLIMLILIILLLSIREPFISRVIPNSKFNKNQNILRYFRYQKIDSINLEISYQDMYKILKDIDKVNDENITNLNNRVIEEINLNYQKIFKDKFGSEKFKINRFYNLDKTHHTYNIDIFRENKHHYFSLQIHFSKNKSKYFVKSINILGIIPSEYLFSFNNNQSLKDLLSQTEVNKIINNKLNSNINYYTNLKSKCFNKKAITKSHCISNDKEGIGIWDKPCNTNNECPFYKKNKNYINTRGGCINGYCEMPLNVKQISYRKYKGNPLCYNCKKENNCFGIECNNCCDRQKNKQIYSSLESPDYIFLKDKIDRDIQGVKSQFLL